MNQHASKKTPSYGCAGALKGTKSTKYVGVMSSKKGGGKKSGKSY